MSFDLVLKAARIAGNRTDLVDIGLRYGKIAAIEPSIEDIYPMRRLDGCLVIPGLVETHVHLDKSDLTDRCTCDQGTLTEAVAAVASVKRGFTEEDVYARAARTLEKSILHGTTHMRTHVEVDPRIGLVSLRALQRLKQDYAWAIDLQLCAFPQEGLFDDPGCEAVLIEAVGTGADLIGGAPYMDRDSHGQIAKIFEIARRYDLDIDLHLDFSLDASHLDVIEVCRQTDAAGWAGRVAIGHVTKLSCLPRERLRSIADQLAAAGVALTVLPATDLFLMGRDHDHTVPRGIAPAHLLLEHGVTCSIATNNVLNPFTPFGDCSLMRIANLYANVAQIGSPAGLAACLEMVTFKAARLLRLDDYGIEVGAPADLVALACSSEAQAIAEIAPPLFGFKRGRQTFERPKPYLLR